MTVKVYNRSTGVVGYSIPEMNITRTFNIGEVKNIDLSELEMLFQMAGGAELIVEDLMVCDKNWVNEHFEAPIEYWWTPDKIKKCVLEDDLDLFAETLDYAPEGVVEYIKQFSWQLPLTDLNKIKILQEKTGFDCLAAVEIMKSNADKVTDITEQPKKERRRREED